MKKPDQTTSSGAFFAVSKFRLISTLVLILMSIIALTPWAFETRIGSIPLINILLTAVMVVGLAVLLIDLIVTRDKATAAREGGASREERHG